MEIDLLKNTIIKEITAEKINDKMLAYLIGLLCRVFESSATNIVSAVEFPTDESVYEKTNSGKAN